MRFKVTTWNINSVRLRMGLVEKFVAAHEPDVLCLQETKVEDGKFPLSDVRAMGFTHIAFNGQKGYHGVAIFSKLPFDMVEKKDFCAKGDARHVSIRFGAETGLLAGTTVHNLYIPAGGDIPDPALNDKFAHKLAFLEELDAWFRSGFPGEDRAILVGDLNIAPLEQDVWSHKQLLDVVSHTPVETEAMQRMMAAGRWVDVMRRFVPDTEKLYTWWSYRAADWVAANKGRRLDHVWASPAIAGAARSMAVLAEARGWDRPSDHAPVTVAFDLG
ncbi:exodeoxyribonuclease III [Labrys wisconsinensis]|uniref:Exodeoxyribonuclease-3 n=1 Tax=Labrys wisconsinensis TaxID=425677 RepID=A0ABU0J1C2_9HYPH|nr:exodeoxyribonuclease III [Labrys wisconsinensis]MDQ0468053.1 exodeoxyribonuclease-3 [Labrys wisconsinensis]